MVKIYINNGIDPYSNNNKYEHRPSRTVFDGKKTWTVVEHIKKEDVNRLSMFVKAFFLSLITFGAAPIFSPKVKGYWESFITGKKIKVVHTKCNKSWDDLLSYSKYGLHEEMAKQFTRLLKKECKTCAFDQIFIASCRATGADVMFHPHDGSFKGEEFRNFEKGKSLLIMIAQDKQASDRIISKDYIEGLKDTDHLQEFAKDYENPVLALSYEDYIGLKLPLTLIQLIQKGN